MEQIAFILGNQFFYRSALVLSLAAAGAVCFFLWLYLKDTNSPGAGFAAAPLALLLALAAGRLLHWYCYPDSYDSLASAMIGLGSGGFALPGIFAGCFLAALLTRSLCLHRELPRMLDCMAIAGSAGIAAGRLSSFFNSSVRGQILPLETLPWAVPVINSVSGETEYRLATFLLQSMASGVIFLMLLVFFLADRSYRRKDGDAALLFALCFGASEILLDSTRYDAIHFRSNGFISVIQVFSLVLLLIPGFVFSVRLVRRGGFRRQLPVLWVLIAAFLGCAGYMEYYVQRHGNQALFAYSIMGICLGAAVLLTLVLYIRCRKCPPRQIS